MPFNGIGIQTLLQVHCAPKVFLQSPMYEVKLIAILAILMKIGTVSAKGIRKYVPIFEVGRYPPPLTVRN